MSTKCLIVGGNGVIGSALKAALSDSGMEVWITERLGNPTGFHRTLPLDLSAPGDFRLPINPRSAFLCAAQSKFLDCDFDVLLMPSAPGEAPHGLESTGDPVFNRIGTVLHLPCITLPGLRGHNGLPIGIQLMGPVWQDAATLSAAHWAHQSLQQ